MKNRSVSLFVLLGIFALALSLHAQTPVRITTHNINLRALPRLENSEVLGQAQYDDQLIAYEIGDEWVSVAPPPGTWFWVNKLYVQRPQNTIGATRVNVRAGPSINHNIVDTLELGANVEPGDELGDWLKIAPPPSGRLWIHRDFVDIPTLVAATSEAPTGDAAAPAKAKTPRKRKPKTAEPTDKPAPPAKPRKPAKKDEPALPTPIVSPSVPARDTGSGVIPVPPPSDLHLIPLQGQGRYAEYEGELRAAPLINEAPSRYRVIRWQSSRWQVLCHVYGEASKFRTLQNKRVRVTGHEYWIQGAAAPVLVPLQIQEVHGDSPAE